MVLSDNRYNIFHLYVRHILKLKILSGVCMFSSKKGSLDTPLFPFPQVLHLFSKWLSSKEVYQKVGRRVKNLKSIYTLYLNNSLLTRPAFIAAIQYRNHKGRKSLPFSMQFSWLLIVRASYKEVNILDKAIVMLFDFYKYICV